MSLYFWANLKDFLLFLRAQHKYHFVVLVVAYHSWHLMRHLAQKIDSLSEIGSKHDGKQIFGLLLPNGVFFAEEYPEVSPSLSVKTNKGCLRKRTKYSTIRSLLPVFVRFYATQEALLIRKSAAGRLWKSAWFYLIQNHTSFSLFSKCKRREHPLSVEIRWDGLRFRSCGGSQ